MAHKLQILSTAPLPDSLTDRITSEGMDVHIREAIAIELRHHDVLTQEVALLAAQPGQIIFTSSNAVLAVAAMLKGYVPQQWNIYCLEGKTLETALQQWPSLPVMATAADSRTLAGKILSAREQSVSPYVFFCGGSRMDTLPALFADAGLVLREIIVYDTLQRRAKLDFAADAALFFSPSAIQSLSVHNDLSAIPWLICIGESTAQAIPDSLLSQVHIAPKASKESVVHTLIQLYKNTLK